MTKEEIKEFLRTHPNSDISQIAANWTRPNVLTLSHMVHKMVKDGELAKNRLKTPEGKTLVQYRVP